MIQSQFPKVGCQIPKSAAQSQQTPVENTSMQPLGPLEIPARRWDFQNRSIEGFVLSACLDSMFGDVLVGMAMTKSFNHVKIAPHLYGGGRTQHPRASPLRYMEASVRHACEERQAFNATIDDTVGASMEKIKCARVHVKLDNRPPTGF